MIRAKKISEKTAPYKLSPIQIISERNLKLFEILYPRIESMQIQFKYGI